MVAFMRRMPRGSSPVSGSSKNARVGVRSLVEARREHEVLLHGQVLEQVRLVGEPGEAPFRGDGIGDDVVTVDRDPACRRAQDADEAAQRRRLAGAVRADEPEDFAGGHGEVELLHGREGAVVLRQGTHVDQGRFLSRARSGADRSARYSSRLGPIPT
jgi:hypothetical protein